VGFRVEKDVMVPMRDGTRLAIYLWTPDGEPAPTLVVRHPYGKNVIAGGVSGAVRDLRNDARRVCHVKGIPCGASHSARGIEQQLPTLRPEHKHRWKPEFGIHR
jgi:hypothetical protein